MASRVHLFSFLDYFFWEREPLPFVLPKPKQILCTLAYISTTFTFVPTERGFLPLSLKFHKQQNTPGMLRQPSAPPR